MRVLVLGKRGMLGHVVYQYLKEVGYEVFGTSTKEDIYYDANQNLEGIKAILANIKPHVVINCIGLLNQACEKDKVLAIRLNSLLPQYLDQLSEEYSFRFIQISTDCVFLGDKGNYREDSLPDASSFYGKTKALGEICHEKNLTLRTSIVGPDIRPDGTGLLQWFMNSCGKVEGYSKVIWTGVTTLELAKQIEVAIQEKLVGLHHVVNQQTISKYELLKLFQKTFAKDITIVRNESIESKKTLLRTEKSFSFSIPSYQEMLEEMKVWIEQHPSLYQNFLSS